MVNIDCLPILYLIGKHYRPRAPRIERQAVGLQNFTKLKSKEKSLDSRAHKNEHVAIYLIAEVTITTKKKSLVFDITFILRERWKMDKRGNFIHYSRSFL